MLTLVRHADNVQAVRSDVRKRSSILIGDIEGGKDCLPFSYSFEMNDSDSSIAKDLANQIAQDILAIDGYIC